MYRRERGIQVDVFRGYGELERIAADVRAQLAPEFSPLEELHLGALFERLDEFYVRVAGREVNLDYAVGGYTESIEAISAYDPDDDKIVVGLR